jgi:hypothetical protein
MREGRERKKGIVEDRWKFDSGRKGRINGAGGTHRGHKSPARPGITGSQLAKYDGLINPSPLARAPPSTTSTSPASSLAPSFSRLSVNAPRDGGYEVHSPAYIRFSSACNDHL